MIRISRWSIAIGMALLTVWATCVSAPRAEVAGAATVVDSPAWSQLSTASTPPARVSATMAYDGATRQLVLFGGLSSISGFSSDTWVWKGSTWKHLRPRVSPPGRQVASMAYDSMTGQLVLFGGVSNGGLLDDTWIWNGTTWAEAKPATSPPPTWFAQMSDDPATHQLVLFGGLSGPHGDIAGNGTWLWSGTNWRHPQLLGEQL